MGLIFQDFHFDLFGIDRTLPVSNANDSVAIQSFTIFWNLNIGYKTNVITLTPKRRTITSNEEKDMIKSSEIRNSSNTCSSRLKVLFFSENLYFWVKNAFFTVSESKIRKKSKILLKGHSIG